MSASGEFSGLAIRALKDAKPLFNTRIMDDAVEMIQKGADLQEVSAKLRHPDPSTVLALIGRWYHKSCRRRIPPGPCLGLFLCLHKKKCLKTFLEGKNRFICIPFLSWISKPRFFF